MTSTLIDSIVWKRLFSSGHDYAALTSDEEGYTLSGTAIFVENRKNVLLHYCVHCTHEWETRSVTVTGLAGEQPIEQHLSVTIDKRWLLNGIEETQVHGCVDVDLAFTPATNLLPIMQSYGTKSDSAIRK